MCCDGIGERCSEKSRKRYVKTYNDETTNGNQIPKDIFLPLELGVCGFKLAQVLIGCDFGQHPC